jgi:hypothetical protein
VVCKTNSQFPACSDISSYPSLPFLNRFCLANKSKTALAALIGKPGSVLTGGATSVAAVEKNALRLNLQINKAITIEEIDGVIWFF